MTRTNTRRIVLTLSMPALKTEHGDVPRFLRVVEIGRAGAFAVERWIDADSMQRLEGNPTRPITPETFTTLDDALAFVAGYAPGHACSARALAFVAHRLNKRGTAARLGVRGDGATVLWCESAAMWIGEDLRDIARTAEREVMGSARP